MSWQLPRIKVLHSGRGSVTIFIMSGYVVTVETVSKIRKREPDTLGFPPWPGSAPSNRIQRAAVHLREQRPFGSSLQHCYPEIQGPAAPGFRTISKLVPGFYEDNWQRIQQFWISAGSILFIVALIFSPPLNLPRIVWWRRNTNITTGIAATADPDSAALLPSPATVETPAGETQRPLLQRPFTTCFAQYLGRISYSLYLARGAVEAADAALARAWRDYCAQVLCAALVNTLVLVWVSDLFWPAVDARAVRAARWLGVGLWLPVFMGVDEKNLIMQELSGLT
ncbi:hypothetical protein DL767_010265 [Monosporascus sp. MG133]|nr:hypothetical protein DL767_010265 [Monosporascus sp. MG133]